MSLHLSHNGQGVYGPVLGRNGRGTHIHHLLLAVFHASLPALLLLLVIPLFLGCVSGRLGLVHKT